MPPRPIQHASTEVALLDAPIDPARVRAGAPVARRRLLFHGPHANAAIFVWDCTAGRFQPCYEQHEIVHILEGSAIINDGTDPALRLVPGDVALFPAGCAVEWDVQTYVRQLAFRYRDLPPALARLARVTRLLHADARRG